jgi:hypothetical protein
MGNLFSFRLPARIKFQMACIVGIPWFSNFKHLIPENFLRTILFLDDILPDDLSM